MSVECKKKTIKSSVSRRKFWCLGYHPVSTYPSPTTPTRHADPCSMLHAPRVATYAYTHLTTRRFVDRFGVDVTSCHMSKRDAVALRDDPFPIYLVALRGSVLAPLTRSRRMALRVHTRVYVPGLFETKARSFRYAPPRYPEELYVRDVLEGHGASARFA